MNKLLLSFAMLFIGVLSFAQIEGKWKTIDDETGKAKSIVEIWKKSDGKYYGKVSQLLIKPEHANCVACKDDRKNKPILGMEIIRGLKKTVTSLQEAALQIPKMANRTNAQLPEMVIN
jgi:hypothetical protein